MASLTFLGEPFDLASTAFFPVTGNPVGFHHLVVGELVLRQFEHIHHIVYILSNGRHPDPTKEKMIPDKYLRLEVLRESIRYFSDPDLSYVAQTCAEEGQDLLLNEHNTIVATMEFARDRVFRLRDHIMHLRGVAPPEQHRVPVRIIAGADLILRMNNPQIFNYADLEELSYQCELLLAPRSGVKISHSVEQLTNFRSVQLKHQEINLDLVPLSLRHFLDLASTMIRRALYAGHDIRSMVPAPAAELIAKHKLYDIDQRDGQDEWHRSCRSMELELESRTRHLKQLLDLRKENGQPHHFALVETSTGGWITAAFSALDGASEHLLEGHVPYSKQAQWRLLGEEIDHYSAVSRETVEFMALRMLEQSKADFVLAETGMAGLYQFKRRSNKQGQCWFCLAYEDTVSSSHVQCIPFYTKKEHQLMFANQALEWFIQHLLNLNPSTN